MRFSQADLREHTTTLRGIEVEHLRGGLVTKVGNGSKAAWDELIASGDIVKNGFLPSYSLKVSR